MKKIVKTVTLALIAAITFAQVPIGPGGGAVAHAAVSDADWIKAVSVQPFSTTDFASDNMKTTLRNIKDTGANYVTLIIPYYQANRQSTEMRPSWNTPTDEALISAITYAHSIGLKVMLKPHLETDYIEWRGNIDPAPADRPAWYASYQAMLVKYGTIGQKYGVEDYCIGTELLRMANPNFDATNTQHWRDMIAAVRKVYSGKVTYSANWWGELDTIQFWDALDYIGISAYYDLYHATNSSPSEIRKSWDGWKSGVIEPIQKQFNKPVVFTELGYRSIDEAYRNPWDWSRWGNFNETDQANSYEGLFSYWTNVPWMKGVSLWRWDINPNAGGNGDTDYTPQNKAAVAVMKKWWGGSSTQTPDPGSNPGTGTGTTSPGTGTGSGGTTTPGTGTGGSTGGTTAPVVSDPNAHPVFQFVVNSVPGTVVAGQPNSIGVAVKNIRDSLNAGVVDIEVYKDTGERVLQQFYENQAFPNGETKNYTVTLNPSTSGTYRVDVGMFSNDWSNLYVWQYNALSISPGSASTPPTTGGTDSGSGTTGTTTNSGSTGGGTTTTPDLPVTLDVWWPGTGVTVDGVQPFKAMFTNKSVNDYKMFWQVEGGMLNEMGSSDVDYPHKESLVRVQGWTWKGSGPYNVNFVAQDQNGNTLGQKSVDINIAQ